MKRFITSITALLAITVWPMLFTSCSNGIMTNMNSSSTSAHKLARESRIALNQLCNQNPKADQLRSQAKAVIVFPHVTKGGLMVGGMGGNGTCFNRDGSVHGYYQTGGVSYGLQAGAQQFGYAIFLMNNEAINYLNNSSGFEFGSAPNLVVVDRGYSTTLSTTSTKKHSYVFFFNQKGLMAGLGLQGSKITRIHPSH